MISSCFGECYAERTCDNASTIANAIAQGVHSAAQLFTGPVTSPRVTLLGVLPLIRLMWTMLLISALLLCFAAACAQPQSSSSSAVSALTSSSSSTTSAGGSSISFYSSSSSVSYNGNEPTYPGCYLCPAITQCPPFSNTTIYPAFSIVATTSASADATSCNAITNDILTEVTQYATTNSCIEAVGYLACYGSLYQELDCHHPISPQWPALCENYTSCLEPAGQAFINRAGLCTNISEFLNRPTSIQTSSSSSSSTGTTSSGAMNRAVRRFDDWLATIILLCILLARF